MVDGIGSTTIKYNPYQPAKAPAAPAIEPKEVDKSKKDNKPGSDDKDPVLFSSPAGVSGASTAALPSLTDSAQLQQILQFLQQAQKKLTDKVKDTIDRNLTEMKEQEKLTLKKKAVDVQDRINIARQKVERLVTQLSKQGRTPLQGQIGQILVKAKQLSQLVDSIKAGVDPGATLTSIDTLIKEINDDLNNLDDSIKRNRLMANFFGEKWHELVNPAAALKLEKGGSITWDDLTEKGKKELAGLENIFKAGLNKELIGRLVTAKRKLAVLLGADPIQNSPKVNETWNKLLSAAIAGKLTEKEANNILKNMGYKIKFNSVSFALIFTGKPNKFNQTEKVDGLEGLVRAVSNFYLTASYVTGMRVGVSDEEWDKVPEEKKGQIPAKFHALFQEYAASKDFYAIDLAKQGSVLKDFFKQKYGDAFLQKLKNMDAYKQRFGEILDNPALSQQEKWNQILLVILQDVYAKLKIKEDPKDPNKSARDRNNTFAKLMEAVQSGKPGVIAAYKAELNEMLFKNKPNFDWKKVVDAKDKGSDDDAFSDPKKGVK